MGSRLPGASPDGADAPQGRSVTVEAPAAVHLGFYGYLTASACYGSVSLALEKPAVVVRCEAAEEGLELAGFIPEEERALREALGRLGVDRVRLISLGDSGRVASLETSAQRLLAAAVAGHLLAKGTWLNVLVAAGALGLGAVSGAGAYAFLHGGLVADTGRRRTGGSGCAEGLPAMLLRYDFPEEWGVVVVAPEAGVGAYGYVGELSEPVPHADGAAAHLLHGVVPGVVWKDFESFARGVSGIQKVQRSYMVRRLGSAVCCEESELALRELEALGAGCVGQDLWGPVVFGFYATRRSAEQAAESLRARLAELGVRALVVAAGPRNTGYGLVLPTAGRGARR